MLCDKCPTQLSIADTNVTVIAGLTPGVDYNLNVAAVNAFGKGQDSITVTAQSATPGMNHKLYYMYTHQGLYYEYANLSLCHQIQGNLVPHFDEY